MRRSGTAWVRATGGSSRCAPPRPAGPTPRSAGSRPGSRRRPVPGRPGRWRPRRGDGGPVAGDRQRLDEEPPPLHRLGHLEVDLIAPGVRGRQPGPPGGRSRPPPPERRQPPPRARSWGASVAGPCGLRPRSRRCCLCPPPSAWVCRTSGGGGRASARCAGRGSLASGEDGAGSFPPASPSAAGGRGRLPDG